MTKHRQARPRGSESNEETLRGKNRELQKKIRVLEHRVRELEKQLGLKPSVPEKEEEVLKEPKKIICDRCGKGEMKLVSIWKPNGELNFLVCEIEGCKHQKKLK